MLKSAGVLLLLTCFVRPQARAWEGAKEAQTPEIQALHGIFKDNRMQFSRPVVPDSLRRIAEGFDSGAFYASAAQLGLGRLLDQLRPHLPQLAAGLEQAPLDELPPVHVLFMEGDPDLPQWNAPTRRRHALMRLPGLAYARPQPPSCVEAIRELLEIAREPDNEHILAARLARLQGRHPAP